jgi:hypothetical protein
MWGAAGSTGAGVWAIRNNSEVNNDPWIVLGILGVAEPITVPTW